MNILSELWIIDSISDKSLKDTSEYNYHALFTIY